MFCDVIQLKDIFKGIDSDAYLQVYIPDNSPEIDEKRLKPTVVICPGGGYGFVSDREAEPVALKFVAEGYNACVLRYSVAPKRYPQQLLELSATMAYIRQNADKWHIDTDKLITCGFSAGGHLVGSLGTLWEESFIYEKLGIEVGSNKPNAMILCYPVITSNSYGHQGSFNNLLGEEATKEQKEALSLEKLVSESTPPTFLWHTFTDNAVPVENTLYFAMALREKQVPFELHIYPEGCHGLSLCQETTAAPNRPELINHHIATWFKLVVEWINKLK